MKKFFSIALMFAAVYLAGCTRIGPGHVGIKVSMAGNDKGVLNTPTTTGWTFYNPMSSSVIEYPTNIQTVVWTRSKDEGKQADESVTFTNKEGMSINADVSLSYSILGEKVPFFYVKFLTDDLEKFTDGFLRNAARNCLNEQAGNYEIEQIMGSNAAFLKASRDCVQAQVGPFGVNIEQFGIIGSPRPPDAVIQNINQKIQASQIALQKQLELQQVQADAAKQVAAAEGHAKAQIASAQGEATANQIRSASITPTILRIRELENQHDLIWRWNGESPKTVVNGDGKNNILQLPN